MARHSVSLATQSPTTKARNHTAEKRLSVLYFAWNGQLRLLQFQARRAKGSERKWNGQACECKQAPREQSARLARRVAGPDEGLGACELCVGPLTCGDSLAKRNRTTTACAVGSREETMGWWSCSAWAKVLNCHHKSVAKLQLQKFYRMVLCDRVNYNSF
jgi:hypothetical protein